MFEVKGLTKPHSIATAVDRVNFRVDSSEVRKYLAPNSLGKSSMVKMLTGLLDSSSAGMFRDGRAIRTELLKYRKRRSVPLSVRDLAGQIIIAGQTYLGQCTGFNFVFSRQGSEQHEHFAPELPEIYTLTLTGVTRSGLSHSVALAVAVG